MFLLPHTGPLFLPNRHLVCGRLAPVSAAFFSLLYLPFSSSSFSPLLSVHHFSSHEAYCKENSDPASRLANYLKKLKKKVLKFLCDFKTWNGGTTSPSSWRQFGNPTSSVSAQPNLNTDGAFRRPLFPLLDQRIEVRSQGWRRNWTKVQFAA